jgi:hypothetical protein
MKFHARHIFAFFFFLIGLFLFGIFVGHSVYDLWHHDMRTALSLDQGELLFHSLWVWAIAYLLAFRPFQQYLRQENAGE